MAKYFKHRGVDNLVYAEITLDDNETSGGYKTGAVKPLAPVARIGKTVETSNNTEYYDNKPMFVVSSEGADEIEIEVTALPLATLAELIGKSYDETLGAMIDTVREEKYFALGYRTKGTDGGYHYIWRLKGMFSIPDEENVTEDNGTDTTGTTLTYTGIHTTHVFEKVRTNASNPNLQKGTAKAVVLDGRGSSALADPLAFFATVVAPDVLYKTT